MFTFTFLASSTISANSSRIAASVTWLSLRRNNFVQFDIQVCSESVPVCILRALPETFNNDNVVFHIVTTFLKITVCCDSVSSIDRKRNRHRIIMLNHVKKRNEEVRLYKHDTEA